MRRTGIGAFVCAGLCILATVVGMMGAFANIANRQADPSKGIDLSQLTTDISNAFNWSLAVVPLIVIGVIFLKLGRSK